MIKGLLLDLSGTVYEDDKLIPGALETTEQLHAYKFPFLYLTNSSRTPRNKILIRLQGMGITVHAEQIFTAPAAIQNYLREHRLTPWPLIHPDIEEEFTEFLGQSPDAVVVCDAEHAFTYENLNRAFRLLIDGASLLAVGDNRYFKQAEGLSLDAGPFVRALEYAVDCKAIVLGKPSQAFFHNAVARLGCKPSEVLMIGDDVYSDINGALKAGLKATLVRTGKYRPGDEGKIVAPGANVCADLLEALRDFQV